MQCQIHGFECACQDRFYSAPTEVYYMVKPRKDKFSLDWVDIAMMVAGAFGLYCCYMAAW